MLARPAVVLCAVCLTVRSLSAQEPAPAPDSPAMKLWQEGQDAMGQGQTDRAIDCYRRSLVLDPRLSRNYLSLAAAFLDKGDNLTACPYLARYVEARPDHLVIRFHYAELLLKLDRPGAARAQFERFVADVQDQPALADAHLIACHSRLMEIAQTEEDEYAEHLHRGIGLYLLGRTRARLHDGGSEMTPESLFCSAAAELTLARLEKRNEARPCWYLHEVWSQLAQSQPAKRWLRAAEADAPFSYLTPAEQRRLEMACTRLRGEGSRK
jgi:tetratricopeptide (TPR) repeat protein